MSNICNELLGNCNIKFNYIRISDFFIYRATVTQKPVKFLFFNNSYNKAVITKALHCQYIICV